MCMVEMANFNIQRAITLKVGKQELRLMCSACLLMVLTPKVGKPELRFMSSARCLMVFNICVKFHENMSSSFKFMERTRKLLTHKGQ